MSATVSKADGVTILTEVSDPNDRLPPLHQVLKPLYHSLEGCSVPPHLKQVQRTSLLVLGVSKKLFFQIAWFTSEFNVFIFTKIDCQLFQFGFSASVCFGTDEDLGWWSLRCFCLGWCRMQLSCP